MNDEGNHPTLSQGGEDTKNRTKNAFISLFVIVCYLGDWPVCVCVCDWFCFCASVWEKYQHITTAAEKLLSQPQSVPISSGCSITITERLRVAFVATSCNIIRLLPAFLTAEFVRTVNSWSAATGQFKPSQRRWCVTWNRVDWQLPGVKNSQMQKVWTPERRMKCSVMRQSLCSCNHQTL